MLKLVPLAAALGLAAVPAAAQEKIELTGMMGRWYEVARAPNIIQQGCQAGASDWVPAADGFSVVQSCHKGAPDGPLAQWKAKARVLDPGANTRIRMTFYGGLVSQEYRVMEHRADQGWLIFGTRDGKYLWLMSQTPTLPAAIRNEAIARIRQLGFDPAKLEFPLPPRR